MIKKRQGAQKVWFGICVMVLITFSCGKKKVPHPPISVPLMSQIIVNLELAETYSINLGMAPDSNKRFVFVKNTDSLYLFYSSVLKHYNISFNEFTDAVNWYKEHPTLMDSMMDVSIEEFNRQTAALNVQTKSTQEAPEENMPPVNKIPQTQFQNKLRPRPGLDTVNRKELLIQN